MGLNATPSANRIHIALFGKRNAGKSSLINRITNQDLAVVSDIPGTTTDPVMKSMELLPLGPVVIIDTPGFDDLGELGEKRVEKTVDILSKTDIALLVTEGTDELDDDEKNMIALFSKKKIPYIIVRNKSDINADIRLSDCEIAVSAKNGLGVEELKEKIASLSKNFEKEVMIVGDLIAPGDNVVLVIPIDSSAPKGRLILPQQQVIRDILDHGGIVTMTKDDRYAKCLESLGEKPSLVICDSQVFGKVSKETPRDIRLTSFSILMARMKGFLEIAVKSASKIGELTSDDTVLICEGCTHHRQCEDIGTVKMPVWITKYTGKNINFEFTSGGEFPEEFDRYSMIVHCGGCMLNEKEMKYRIDVALRGNIPITNYGIAIAYMNGILERSISPFLNEF